MGKTLGGRPDDKSVLNKDIESKDWYQSSIENLIKLSLENNIVIMCSEENPERCHRGILLHLHY